MDLEYLLFERIVRTGSLSAAGREAKLSPAAVSKQLTRLERRLGVQLIHRTTRRLALTEAGRTFFEDVVAVLAAMEAAEARVVGRAGAPAGRLRVSAPTSFGRMHIAPHLAAFLDAHPNVELELQLDDAFADLLEDRIDVAIRISPTPTGLGARLLAPNLRVLCAAPAYLAAHGEPTTLKQLAQHHVLAAAHQTPWRLEGPRGAQTFDARSRVATNSSEVVRELALAGVGVALRSTWDVGEELKAGRLVRVLPQWRGAAHVGICAVWPSSALAPVNVRAFVDYLSNIYGATPYWDR